MASPSFEAGRPGEDAVRAARAARAAPPRARRSGPPNRVPAESSPAVEPATTAVHRRPNPGQVELAKALERGFRDSGARAPTTRNTPYPPSPSPALSPSLPLTPSPGPPADPRRRRPRSPHGPRRARRVGHPPRRSRRRPRGLPRRSRLARGAPRLAHLSAPSVPLRPSLDVPLKEGGVGSSSHRRGEREPRPLSSSPDPRTPAGPRRAHLPPAAGGFRPAGLGRHHRAPGGGAGRTRPTQPPPRRALCCSPRAPFRPHAAASASETPSDRPSEPALISPPRGNSPRR